MDGLLGAGGGGKEYDVAPHPPKLLGVLLPPLFLRLCRGAISCSQFDYAAPSGIGINNVEGIHRSSLKCVSDMLNKPGWLPLRIEIIIMKLGARLVFMRSYIGASLKQRRKENRLALLYMGLKGKPLGLSVK